MKIEPAESAIENRKSLNRGVELRYPLDIGTHSIVFNFVEYSFNETFRGGKETRSSTGSIVLPLPTNLLDSYSIQIGQEKLNTINAGVIDLLSGNESILNLLNNANSTAKSLGAVLGGTTKSFLDSDSKSIDTNLNSLKNSASQANLLARNTLESVFSGAGLAIDTVTGETINPHITLSFNGIDLKNHTFEWTLSPKNEAESVVLRRIIQTFKKNALPKYKSAFSNYVRPDNPNLLASQNSSLSRALLKYPSIVRIFFAGIDPNYFYFFKPAVIQSMSINYAPNSIAINRGGRPTAITFSIQLTETSIWTSDDISTDIIGVDRLG